MKLKQVQYNCSVAWQALSNVSIIAAESQPLRLARLGQYGHTVPDGGDCDLQSVQRKYVPAWWFRGSMPWSDIAGIQRLPTNANASQYS